MLLAVRNPKITIVRNDCQLRVRDTLNKAVIVWIVIAEATMGVRTASRGLLGRAWSR